MNHLKQVWQWVSTHWVMPTPAELIAEELIHAQRSKLRKFKCTGCTGTWTDREDAKHHLCKDYQ
jgi:hypothetical protein